MNWHPTYLITTLFWLTALNDPHQSRIESTCNAVCVPLRFDQQLFSWSVSSVWALIEQRTDISTGKLQTEQLWQKTQAHRTWTALDFVAQVFAKCSLCMRDFVAFVLSSLLFSCCPFSRNTDLKLFVNPLCHFWQESFLLTFFAAYSERTATLEQNLSWQEWYKSFCFQELHQHTAQQFCSIHHSRCFEKDPQEFISVNI